MPSWKSYLVLLHSQVSMCCHSIGGVERTFACFGRYRRLSKDDKKTDQEQRGDEPPGINPHLAQVHIRSRYNFQTDSQANITDECACAAPQRDV